MERGSRKHGFSGDDRLKTETEPVERSGREQRSQDARKKEAEDLGSGHRIEGTGTSAEAYNWTDHGEQGGDSHPKPKEEDR